MVFWHTAYKKHHSYLIRKTRFFNFFIIGMGFYYLYWYNRYESKRSMWYMEHVKPTQERANSERRNYGFRERYEPLLARSRKHYLYSKGEGAPRIPYEDQLLP